MDTKQGKEYLIKEDFEVYPIWKFNDVDDLMYPVSCAEEFPDNAYDLRIRADFVTKSGIILKGYIVGVQNIFSIGIYIGDQSFHFNKNFLSLCADYLNQLNEALGVKLLMSEFSPLHYTTTIDLEGFSNISGEFDILQKRTLKEQLGDAWGGK